MPTQTEIASFLKEMESGFLPYQRRWIADKSRFRLYEKAVRTGITYCHSYQSAKKRTFRHPSLKPINELFASKNRDVASEYMRYHRKWGEAFNTFWPGLIDFGRWTTERAVYPGGEILIFSSDPDAFRGMEGDPTLDEVAFHERQADLYAAAQSRIQWLPDGQVSMISSHADPDTEFARWASDAKRNKDSHWSLHRTTLEDAVKQGLADKVPGPHHRCRSGRGAAFIESIRRTCNSEEDFLREYMCQPAALSAAVKASDYDTCVLGDVPDALRADVDYGNLYVGMDCGFVNDSSVLWVLEQSRVPDSGGQYCYRTVCVKVMKRVGFEEQCRALSPIILHPRIHKGLIDQGALGYPFAQRVKQYTGSIIEPFGFSAPKKGVMANRVRAWSQSHRLSFPPDPNVRSSVLCVRGERQLGGSVKWDGSTSFDHGDAFWALALALHAAEEGRVTMSMAGQTAGAA